MLTVERPSSAPAPVQEGIARRAWGVPLWGHALAFAVLLVALAPLMHLGTTFTSDEGAYALQARTLADGTWGYEYKAEGLDPERRWMPLLKADVSDDAIYPYARHPAFPRALQAAVAVFGEPVGLYAWSVLGALLLAVACWLLAAEVAPGAERAAFWVGAAGPVAVNAYLVWGHALSAAVGGLAVVAAVRFLRRGPSAATCAWLAASLVAGALLRSEGLLFAVAVGIGLAVAVARSRGAVRGAVAGAVAVVPVGAAVAIETAWQRGLFGAGYSQVTGRRSAESFLAGRVRGAWHELLAGAVGDQTAALFVLVAVALVVWAAAVRRREPTMAVVAVAAAAALYAVRLIVQDEEPVTGLLAAWPVALLGLALVPRRRLLEPPVALVAATTALFAAAVLATQYAEGGGWEWGGRFFSPALAPLAVLAVVGLRAGGLDRRALAALAALTVLPVVLGLGVLVGVRSSSGPFFDEVERVASAAPLAVTTIEHLPRALWEPDDRIAWMMAPEDDLGLLLDDLADQDVPELVLVTSAGVDRAAVGERFVVADDLSGPAVRARGRAILRLVAR